jgi:hypothetical protein
MSSGHACNGECGALYARYRKYGLSGSLFFDYPMNRIA